MEMNSSLLLRWALFCFLIRAISSRVSCRLDGLGLVSLEDFLSGYMRFYRNLSRWWFPFKDLVCLFDLINYCSLLRSSSSFSPNWRYPSSPSTDYYSEGNLSVSSFSMISSSRLTSASFLRRFRDEAGCSVSPRRPRWA